jgi:hypothetical protein
LRKANPLLEECASYQNTAVVNEGLYLLGEEWVLDCTNLELMMTRGCLLTAVLQTLLANLGELVDMRLDG